MSAFAKSQAELGRQLGQIVGGVDEAAEQARATADTLLADSVRDAAERAAAPSPGPAMLQIASEQPGAPRSLTKLAVRVADGELSWADVMVGTDDPDVKAFRAEAFAFAKAKFDVVDSAVDSQPKARFDDNDEEGGSVPRGW